MAMRGRMWVLVGVVGVMALLLGVLFLGPLYVRARQLSAMAASSWTTVFTDTFETPSAVWTVTDNVSGTHQWGVAPYLVDMGATFLVDHGLWAAGGGTVGQTQTWPTGTYTNSMTTWAVAGPFTPTQRVWDMQLSLAVYNDAAPNDVLFIGLSDDGIHFEGMTVTVSTLALQSINWSTRAYSNSAAVWIGLRFTSDAQDVAAGPMVDNLALAFNDGSNVYLPLIKRDPTPTPTPIPTPVPAAVYFDSFDNPSSGWYTGPALRYNDWCRYTYFDCHEGWEVVATMSYYELNHNYRIEIPLTWHGGGDVDTWFVWPAMAAPLPESYYPLPTRYCIEARGVFANWLDQDYQPYWAHWGILFGANESMTELYSFQVNANHDYAVLQHHNYTFPGNRQPLSGEEVNVETRIVNWSTDIPYLIPTHNYNVLKVVVDGNAVDIYVNNHWLRHADVGNMPRGRIGLIGGSWEVTPIDMQIDYFRYEANCGPVQ